jgi:hypothetical protein
MLTIRHKISAAPGVGKVPEVHPGGPLSGCQKDIGRWITSGPGESVEIGPVLAPRYTTCNLGEIRSPACMHGPLILAHGGNLEAEGGVTVELKGKCHAGNLVFDEVSNCFGHLLLLLGP